MKKIMITHIPLVLSCSMISLMPVIPIIDHYQSNKPSLLFFGLIYPLGILLALIIFLAPYTTFYLEKNKLTASKFLGLRRKTSILTTTLSILGIKLFEDTREEVLPIIL